VRRSEGRSLPTLAALVALLGAAVALRWYHLGTFSLWWDEIVHIWTSQGTGGGLREVLLEVKRGIPPGAGNAGAVPLDYALLHLYLRATAPPAPERLEIYYRLPAFLYRCAALPLLYALGRRFLDRQVALVATLLLALSVTHVLYAAEARFYSLFVLTTTANLYAFASLVEDRLRWRRWAAYGAVNVLFFFSGLFSVGVLVIQYAILAGFFARDLARSRRGLEERPAASFVREAVALLASGAVVAACVAAYLSGTSLDHKYRRDPARVPDALGILWSTLETFSGHPVLFFFLLLLPLPWLYARRRRALAPVVLYLQASLLLLPAIVETARWKRYYFHPRHALFLLPAVEVLIAISLVTAVRMLDPLRVLRLGRGAREAGNLVLACGLALVVLLPAASRYLEQPTRSFSVSKKTYDLKGVARAVRDAVADAGPREKYLLIVQRNSMANTALAQYLRWYGLEDRVVLRGTFNVQKTAAQLGRMCAAGCLGQRGPIVDRALGLVGPLGIPVDFQRLLGLLKPIGAWPGTVEQIGVLTYGKTPLPGGAPPGAVRRFRGARLLELKPEPAPST